MSRKYAFMTVDAWRTEEERERLIKWNLTALTHMHVDDWETLFTEAGYTGDYYWFIAEQHVEEGEQLMSEMSSRFIELLTGP